MWAVMMAGMMLPSATPVIVLVLNTYRRRGGRGAVLRTYAFAAGYLVAWTAFSAAATALQWRLADAAEARRVHVLAQRRAFPVAAYLAYGLTQLEVPAFLMDSVGGMLRQQAALLRDGDLLIAASFRNYSSDVVEAAAACHRNGVPVVALTDHAVSPLAKAATIRFDLGDNLALPFRSLVGPMCAAQALVMMVGYAQAEKPGRKALRKRA